MISVLGQLALDDLSNFLSVFAAEGEGNSHTEGNRVCQIYSVSKNEKQVMVLFEWTSLETWHEFLDDPQVQDALSSGAGERPRFTVLESVGEFQGFGKTGRASKFLTNSRDFVGLGAPVEELIVRQLQEKAKRKQSVPRRHPAALKRDENAPSTKFLRSSAFKAACLDRR